MLHEHTAMLCYNLEVFWGGWEVRGLVQVIQVPSKQKKNVEMV